MGVIFLALGEQALVEDMPLAEAAASVSGSGSGRY